MINWAEDDLQQTFEAAGFEGVEIITEGIVSNWRIDVQQIERWFDLEAQGKRPTFAQHLLSYADGAGLAPAEVEFLKQSFQQQLLNNIVSWQSTIAYLVTSTI